MSITPTNPTAPSKTPGGSSSGAAVAVAANLADFSLGIDTVGGVRVPAAFCGIMGFRPSHGALSHTGIIPVSTSLDTVDFKYAHVLEPTNKRAAAAADRLRKLFLQ